jgi:hypothetical protein
VCAIQVTAHIFLGQWFTAVAIPKNVIGMPIAPVPVFWNVEKTAPSRLQVWSPHGLCHLRSGSARARLCAGMGCAA